MRCSGQAIEENTRKKVILKRILLDTTSSIFIRNVL